MSADQKIPDALEEQLLKAVRDENKRRDEAKGQHNELTKEVSTLHEALDKKEQAVYAELKQLRDNLLKKELKLRHYTKIMEENRAKYRYNLYQAAKTEEQKELKNDTRTATIFRSWVKWIKARHMINPAVKQARQWLMEALPYITDLTPVSYNAYYNSYHFEYKHQDDQCYHSFVSGGSHITNRRKRFDKLPAAGDPLRLQWLCLHYPDVIHWQRWLRVHCSRQE